MKQRLLGAAVIIALIVIIIPMFLARDNSKTTSTVSINASIPPESQQSATSDTIVLSANQSEQEVSVNPDVAAFQPNLQDDTPTAQVASSNTQVTAAVAPNLSQAPLNTEEKDTTSTTVSPRPITYASPHTSQSDSHTVALSSQKSTHTNDVVTVPKSSISSSSNKQWVMQLGSFANGSNAILLQKQLSKAGFSAFTQVIQTAQGKKTRVLIGPTSQREQLVAIQAKLQRDYHIKGAIVVYQPN